MGTVRHLEIGRKPGVFLFFLFRRNSLLLSEKFPAAEPEVGTLRVVFSEVKDNWPKIPGVNETNKTQKVFTKKALKRFT